MKKTAIFVGLTLLLLAGCTKPEFEEYEPINLGTTSTSTSIKSIIQNGNTVTATFETTIGAKYSVQIIPFGEETPVKKEGFTATDITTKKVIDLSGLGKKDYDLIFIDVSGKEAKYPIVVK
jgi:hypothetical protein